MADHPLLTFWLGALAGMIPSTLAAVAICVCALVHRQRIGPAFRWTLLGFGLLVVTNLVAPATYFLVQQRIEDHHLVAQEAGALFAAHSIACSCVYAVAYGLMGIAIFVGRDGLRASLPPPLPALPDAKTF